MFSNLKNYPNLRRCFSTSYIDLIYTKKEICPHYVYQIKNPIDKPHLFMDNPKLETPKFHRQSPNLNSQFVLKPEDRKLIDHFVNERLLKLYPNLDYKQLIMVLLKPANFSRYHLFYYNNFKEFLEFIFENINYLVKHVTQDRLNNFLPSTTLFLMKNNLDFLKSFRFKISHLNLIHITSLKQLNHEELAKVYDLKGDLDDESNKDLRTIESINFENDLIERRLTLIDYLSEDVKNDLFRKDKDELFKLNLDQLDDFFIARLLKHFLKIERIKFKYGHINFMNLNSILRTYSRFWYEDIQFLDANSKLESLNCDFFNHIINNLPDSYFQSYINLERLHIIFSSKTKLEDNFNLLKKYQPNLTIFQLIDLLSALDANPNAKDFKYLISTFFKTFDLDSIEDKDRAYHLIYNFIEFMPKNDQSFENYIRKSMFSPDQISEQDSIKDFLVKESMSNSSVSRRLGPNYTMIASVLKCDRNLIKKQLFRHPNAKKTKVTNLPLILDYLLQELTIEQIRCNPIILLYSLEAIKSAFESLRQDEELYDRVKTKDNVTEYLLYMIEKNSSFTGNAVFLNRFM